MAPLMNEQMTRRRVLQITAGLTSALLLPGKVQAGNAPIEQWHGQALGAHATITLAGVSHDTALSVFADIEQEVARLEEIFSLYRSGSVLLRLNAKGRLADPPAELLEVLSLAQAVHGQTEGLFDPTVQALFAYHASALAMPDPKRNLDQAGLDDVLRRIDFRSVAFDDRRISYEKPDMAMTLNGIAQGYITDQVAALLRGRGFENVLVNLGEIVAMGAGRTGHGWRIGIGTAVTPETLALTNRAVATSAVHGTVLDADGTVGHIFHPQKGVVRPFYQQVTVVDASAARADAFSTAAALMDETGIGRLRAGGVEVYV